MTPRPTGARWPGFRRGEVHVRDSKHTAGPQLALTQDTWTAFVTGVLD
ncbi:DUF397 domain-containing protein [Streptomyces bauhiniae]